MPKTILFDIDRTLFNTPLASKRLLDLVDSFLKKHGLDHINSESLLKQYLKTLKTQDPFQLHLAVEFVVSSLLDVGIDKKDSQKLYQAVLAHLQSDFLYDDVLPTIKQLHNRKIPLGIFSQSSSVSWQKRKIKKLESYLKPDLIFISVDKTNPKLLKTLPKQATIIDDRVEIIKALVEFASKHDRNWQVYLIDRHELVESEVKQELEKLGIQNLKSLREFSQALSKKAQK